MENIDDSFLQCIGDCEAVIEEDATVFHAELVPVGIYLSAQGFASEFIVLDDAVSYFFRTLSLFVIAAINVELNTSLIALSSVVLAVEDVVVSSLFGLRYVVKESGLFAGLFGGVFIVGS